MQKAQRTTTPLAELNRLVVRHATRRYDVTDWLKDREARETLADYAKMLQRKPRLREEFAAIYHDRYGKAYGLPEALIQEILAA